MTLRQRFGATQPGHGGARHDVAAETLVILQPTLAREAFPTVTLQNHRPLADSNSLQFLRSIVAVC